MTDRLCIVAGSGDTLPADIEAVNRHHSPSEPVVVIAINEAVKLIFPTIIASYHCEKMDQFDHMARKRWGPKQWKTYAACPTERNAVLTDYPAVDFWLPGTWAPAATSAFFGIIVAKELGYNNIVLCGCPLTATGYSVPTHKATANDPRFGWMNPDGSYHCSVRETWQMKKHDGFLQDVHSMSGWTKDLLGEPTWH